MNKERKINKKYVIAVVVLIVLVLYFIFGGGSSDALTYTVGRADVSRSVVLSGTVATTDKADLGFAAGGRVSKIFVTNNQKVTRGQVLAQLEIGDLLADLKIKQANYKTSDVDLDSNLESKYRLLLSSDLTLVPEDETSTLSVPTVEGIYAGMEGTYKIIIRNDDVNRTENYIYTFDLEKSIRILNKKAPTPLGTKGLYISFGDVNPVEYNETVWYLHIPNKAGSSYVANFNAYTEAKKRVESADKSTNDSVSAVAQAEIQKINAEIRKNTIYAPFDGRVTNIEKEVGENASSGESVMSVLGEGGLEVVMQVSELDVSKIVPNAPIEITLDAFSSEIFSGVVKTINSRDTQVDGVSVYEAFVELKKDERIKTGMSANGTITIATKPGVLAVPSYYVKTRDGKNFVELVLDSGDTVEAEVTLGLVGTDSMVEVVSGLKDGDKISTTAKK